MMKFIFDQKCFNIESAEEQMIFFLENKNLYCNLYDFSIACAKYQYDIEKDYISSEHSWNKRQEIFDIYPISAGELDKYISVKDGLKYKLDIEPYGVVTKAFHIYSDWDYFLCTVETNKFYYGIAWETTA